MNGDANTATEGPEIGADSQELPEINEDFLAQILSSIKAYGYAYLKPRHTLAEFEAIARWTGTLASRSDIRIDVERVQVQQRTRKVKNRPSAYQAQALGFHSDNPHMSVLAWYCMEQDETGGTMLLLDSSDVGEYFSADELSTLQEINIQVSERLLDSEEERFTLEPLVSRDGSGYRVYYQPWLLLDSYEPEKAAALAKFSAYLKHKQSAGLLSVPIKKYQSLFIDNNRILHGRDAIAENSKRHLVRFFIRTDRVRN
jgi:hypothetical protein